MATISRTDIAAKLAEQLDLSKKKAEVILKAYEAIIVENVKVGNEVKLLGFAKFSRQNKEAREGRNPRTGAAIQIPAKAVAKAEAKFKLA